MSVITGTREPIRILAFSRLRARILGLPSVLVVADCFIRLTVTAGGGEKVTVPLVWLPMSLIVNAAPESGVIAMVALVG